jgi:hypothetical protein
LGRADEAAFAQNLVEKYEMLGDAVRDMTAAMAPELSQTDQMIQRYVLLGRQLGRMGGFLKPYIELLKEKSRLEKRQIQEDVFSSVAASVMSLAGGGSNPYQSLITDIRAYQKAHEDIAPQLEHFIDLILRLEAEAEATATETYFEEMGKALRDAQAAVAEMMGEGPTKFESYISTLEDLKQKYPELAAEIDLLIAKVRGLNDEFLQVKAIEDFASNLEVGLGIAKTLFDLTQDGNWTDGNKLLSAFYEIGATVVSLIPVIGPALGKIVSMVGQFINSIIGNMSNGARRVREEIEGIAKSNSFISDALAESLTVTKRVGRGGLLGFLGFTMQAVDEELTQLNIAMAQSFGGAMKSGIMAALSGDKDWRKRLGDGVRETVLNALVDAFISAQLAESGIAEFVTRFNAMMASGQTEAARAFAVAQVALITEGMEEASAVIADVLNAFYQGAQQDAEKFASSLSGGLAGAYSAAIKAAASGVQDWKVTLKEGVQDAVADGIIAAFVETRLQQGAVKRFIDEFDRLIDMGDNYGAARFAEEQLASLTHTITAGAGILGDALRGLVRPVEVALEELNNTLQNGLSGSLKGALSSGILDAVRGDSEWAQRLEESLKEVIAKALIDAFVEAMVMREHVQQFISDFVYFLEDMGAEGAVSFGRTRMDEMIAEMTEGAKLMADLLEESGLLVRPPPKLSDPRDYNNDFFNASSGVGYFQLPTASASLISATPAWIDNLGMHFAKFGTFVDRLVDEGITVNVAGSGTVGSAGVSARDIRLLR